MSSDIPTQSQAQQRANDILAMRRELARLQQERVFDLTPAQAEQLGNYHNSLLKDYRAGFDIDCDQRSHALSLGMRMASLCAALALSGSVFFLLLHYWGRFSVLTQVTILIGASFSSFWATYQIRNKDASGYFAAIAALVALLCFILNVKLLADIFNIVPNYLSEGISAGFWAFYALLLAYLCNSRLLLAAGIALAIYASGRVLASALDLAQPMYEGLEQFFPAALLLFMVPHWLDQSKYHGFASIYRVISLIVWLALMFFMAYFYAFSFFSYFDGVDDFYRIIGIIGAALFIWLGIRYAWSGVDVTGLVFFIIFLYATLLDWLWQAIPKYLLFLIIGATAVLILKVLQRWRQTAKLRHQSGWGHQK